MILIVDDKKENLLSLQSILALHGFPVHTAESGEEALKKVLKNNYALIILDVQMPGMDGFEVAEMISGYSKADDVPIIFLSAVNTDKRFITKGYTSGAVDYITKPIDPDIFLLKVNTLYKLYEQKRELSEMQVKLSQEIEYRKKAQQESFERAQQLFLVLDSIPQIAFTASSDGTIEYGNSQWKEYTGWSQKFPTTHADDPDLEKSIGDMARDQSPLEFEIRIKKPSMEDYRYFLLRTVPIRENDVTIRWVGTFTDIDDQKQIIKKKDEFISMASHELKTPLTSMKGYIQLLERSMDVATPTYLYVERTLVQIRKLDNLIADLLEVSRVESGHLKLTMKDFSFDEMVHNCVVLMRETYQEYEFISEGSSKVTVCGDESRMEQVLLNFLSNAVKYSPDNKKIVITTHIPKPGMVEVKIKDFGIGIPKDEQSKVFEKFYRSAESTTSFQGLGLGLYICADILQRHEASYGVESEVGEGSIFYFCVPYKA